MNILDICVNAPFNIGFSYQENLLPKYHKLNGNNVTVLAPEYEYSDDGKVCKSTVSSCIDSDGVTVKRIAIRGGKSITARLKRFVNLYGEIEEANPDIIFCHLFQFLDLDQIVKYVKRHKNVKLYIDSHADYNNSASSFLSKKILHGIIWKRLAHKALPYAEKFYGVTPARVDFLLDMYGLPKEKVELLPLCADDELVEKTSKPEVRERLRDSLGISDNQTLIVSGGKIDHNKPQTLLLMQAINKVADSTVRLAVFGSVNESLKEQFDAELSDRVIYIGWKNIEEIYELFAAADIVAFPGLHSVLWEQAVGMGKPCVFKKIPGFNHVDLGGNCMFFESDAVDEYMNVILKAMENADKMAEVAKERGMKAFSYKNIAKKSIGES